MSLTLVTAPTVEPLSVAEARARLNMGSEVSDTVLGAFITAARMAIDGADGNLGRALITQTWRLTLDDFPPCSSRLEKGFPENACGGWRTDGRPSYLWNAIKIPLPPLQQIVSVAYIDGGGVSQTLAGSGYQTIPGAPARLIPAAGQSWPGVSSGFGAVTIDFKCGYGDDGSKVPEPIRAAIALEASRLRSLSGRDQNVMVDNVIGVGSKTYAVGRDGGADGLSAAAQALLANYRVFAS